MLRGAKLYEIGAGTSEMRRMLIGRELFRETELYKQTADSPQCDHTPMTILKSSLRTDALEFPENREHMQVLNSDLEEQVALMRSGGSAAARKKQRKRGKMLVRDRITTLLDPGSPFLELSQFAAWWTAVCLTNSKLFSSRPWSVVLPK